MGLAQRTCAEMRSSMWQIMMTFTVIFLCIMLIRLLFRGKISSRLRYGLWLLVVLRLMLPISIQVGDMGEMRVPDLAKNIGRDSGAVIRQLGQNITESLSETQGDTGIMRFILPDYAKNGSAYDPDDIGIIHWGKIWFTCREAVWYAGILLVAVWIVATNVIFYRGLQKSRKAYELPQEVIAGLPPQLQRAFRKEKPVRVYVMDELASPCLYGLPGAEAVYLTVDVTQNDRRLIHVLTHELCHKKHGDSFWSLIRSILVACYWFHPLVWATAVLSKRDCELACDESAILLLGEEERIPYGETLLSIITRKGRMSDVVCAATTMTGSSKSIKERIQFIAGNSKVLGVAVTAVFVLAAAILFFCFTKDERMKGGMVYGSNEIRMTGADMQFTLPASIGGISGWTSEEGKTDVIIYQVASGKEVGRFCKIDLKDALQLIDEGRHVVPLGNYGYNYMLWHKMGVTDTPTEARASTADETKQQGEMISEQVYETETPENTYMIKMEDETVYLPSGETATIQMPNEEMTEMRFFTEDVNVDELPESDCYIYLKADYSKVKDKYLEEMEFINGELEGITEDVIVLSFTQEYRDRLYENLAEHRTLYVGNASEVGALVHALPVPDGLEYSDLSITENTLCINYDMTAEYLDEIDSHMIFFDAVMLFASIGNMDECVIAVEDGSAYWMYYRTELEQIFDYGLRYQDCEEDMFVGYMQLLYSDIVEYLADKEEVSE